MNLCIPDQYNHSKLMSMQELLDHIKAKGAYGWVLGEIKDQYEKQLGREMDWHYPLQDGFSTGCFIVPVREGYLFIPYDEVDRENYEVLDLDEAKMMSAESCDSLAMNARSIANTLCEYLQSIQSALPYLGKENSAENCNENPNTCKSRGLCGVCGEHFCGREMDAKFGENDHLTLLRKHNYPVCADCFDRVLADLSSMSASQAVIYLEGGIVGWMSVPEESVSGYLIADYDDWKDGDMDWQIQYLQNFVLAHRPGMRFVN